MARITPIARELQIATAGLQPDAISKLLAEFARQSLAEAIAAGEASPHFTRFVDGREGASEDTVKPDGYILYDFDFWPEVMDFAWKYAAERSPDKTGRYRESWFWMVNGALYEPGADIPEGAELILTNDQPYSRKIETGHMRMSVPPGIVEDTRQAVLGLYGNFVQAQKRFISLAGAYTLRLSHGDRKDMQAGREITYPALILTGKL